MNKKRNYKYLILASTIFFYQPYLKIAVKYGGSRPEHTAALDFFFYLPTTIPKAPNVRDFGLDQKSGGCSIPIGTTIVFVA